MSRACQEGDKTESSSVNNYSRLCPSQEVVKSQVGVRKCQRASKGCQEGMKRVSLGCQEGVKITLSSVCQKNVDVKMVSRGCQVGVKVSRT